MGFVEKNDLVKNFGDTQVLKNININNIENPVEIQKHY